MPTPASVKMPTMFSQHCLVLSAMLPSIRLPLVSAGIWPETKTWGPAMMAWDWVGQRGAVYVVGVEGAIGCVRGVNAAQTSSEARLDVQLLE
jgi:hypothetical protein